MFGIALLLDSTSFPASQLPYLSIVREMLAGDHENQSPPNERSNEATAIATVPRAMDPKSQALELVMTASKYLDGGLHRCQQWGLVRDLYFEAGAKFALAGEHVDAANAYANSAGICKVYATDLEVANANSFAVDSLKVFDPCASVALLSEQSETYQRLGLNQQAAKAEKDAAELSQQLGNCEAALAHFQAAVELYSGANGRIPTALTKCEERVRQMMVHLKMYAEAAKLYEAAAIKCPSGLTPTFDYFCAILCLIAHSSGENFGGGIARAKRRFGEFQDEDKHLRKGRENRILRDIFAGFDKPSIAMIDEAVDRYCKSDGVRQDVAVLELLAQCKTNLYEYLLPYM